jgi:hypothetical protein
VIQRSPQDQSELLIKPPPPTRRKGKNTYVIEEYLPNNTIPHPRLWMIEEILKKRINQE